MDLPKPAKFLALVVLGASTGVSAAFAKVDIAGELMRSNILRPDQSISADVQERDATISTYTNKQAVNNKDAVCRFDALLIAKKVTELAPSVKKVRVWFHEYTGSSYREVIVSADDLKAFEAGKLKKEQLLGRLKVRLANSLKPAESFVRNTAPVVEQGGIKTGTGVAFYYPKGWHAQQRAGDSRLLAALSWGPGPNGPDVQLKIVEKDAASKDGGPKKSVKVGYGQGSTGTDVTSISEENGKERIERRVYFSDGRYNYKLSLVCNTDDYNKANADFNYILSTLNLKS